MIDAKTLGNESAFPVIPPTYESPWYPYPSSGLTLRQHFPGLVDVSVYSPRATFELRFGRLPTVDELAEYIASIRVIEADALLAELAKEPRP